jgi:hypothetical protein
MTNSSSPRKEAILPAVELDEMINNFRSAFKDQVTKNGKDPNSSEVTELIERTSTAIRDVLGT